MIIYEYDLSNMESGSAAFFNKFLDAAVDFPEFDNGTKEVNDFFLHALDRATL